MHEIVLDKQYVIDVMCVLSVAVAFNHSMFCNMSVSFIYTCQSRLFCRDKVDEKFLGLPKF